ncbi:butyrophilin subfamily 1 member A1 isoform X2 [Microcebus murinus]|uniref:butyrophilin subfamily 1 member A1 isoform X2 n=1 Tax=Microcebus murinus TaxID=30608 RepID=UPI003F6A945D
MSVHPHPPAAAQAECRLKLLRDPHQSLATSERPGMAVFPNSCLPRCLFILTLLQLPKLSAAHFDVIGPSEPILAMVGEDAELPCHLSPNMNAERMELRWFRRKVSPAVLVHREGREQKEEQMPEYGGRVTLAKDDISVGRAAVRIQGVRASDDGEYQCLFRENGSYGIALLHLTVAALGSDPHIHMEVQESGEISLECTSVGWYPEPQVQWRTPKGEQFPSTSESRNPDEEGLFTVASSVIIRDTSMEKLSCYIQNLLLGQEKEVEISIPDTSVLTTCLRSITPWRVAVAVILTALGLVTIGFIFFTWRLYKERSRERKNALSPKADMILDPDTAHPHLFLYEDLRSVRLEDSRRILPERPERFDSWPCVLGCKAFTSGRHHWEVEVGDRTDWAIGVCRENVRRKGFDPIIPENGFWALELYGNGYWALTPLRTPLLLSSPLHRVGIFLDYELGNISFYNMTNGHHIYTFSENRFSGPLRPLFCLWSSGEKPLIICPLADGPESVTVIANAQDLSKEIPLSPMGEDSASEVTDTFHSKLIPTQPSQGAP